MHKSLLIILLCFLILLSYSFEANSGILAPELERIVGFADPSEKIPIIVILHDRIDLTRFKDKRKAIRRARIIRALRDKASKAQQPLRKLFLRKHINRFVPIWLINAIALSATPEVIRELAKHPAVESIEIDAQIPAPELPADSGSTTAEWNIDSIRARGLWTLGFRGQGVVIASTDTGVDWNHPDLKRRWRGGNNSWWDAYDPDYLNAKPSDSSGHGTAVMGLMLGGNWGGSAIGVAPGAQWISAKIFNETSSSSSIILEAFQWLLDPDGNPDTDDTPDVVNNSWADRSTGVCKDKSYREAAQMLKAFGIAMVYAAGNEGGASQSPANWPESYAVGAVNEFSEIAEFSSHGPSACDGSIYPEVVAPGEGIRSSVPATVDPDLYRENLKGTSYAAPHVTGAMALLLSAFPGLSPFALERALIDSAHDAGDFGPDNEYGYGIIDVKAAYQVINNNRAKLVIIYRRQDNAFKLEGHNPPMTVDDDLGSPIASDSWLGKKVAAAASANYDSDPEDELLILRKRIDDGLSLDIYDMPTMVGDDVKPIIASDNWIGKNIIAVSGANYDDDPEDELVVVRQRQDNGFRLKVFEMPSGINTDTGPPIATDDWIGENVVAIGTTNFDEDPRDELIIVRRLKTGVHTLGIYNLPDSIDGNTGPPIASYGNLGTDAITDIAVANYDDDPEDEIAILRKRLDGDFKLEIIDMPTTLGDNLGGPIASNNWIGSRVKAITSWQLYGL